MSPAHPSLPGLTGHLGLRYGGDGSPEHWPRPVAVLRDWSAWWAATLDAMPTDRLDPLATVREWYGRVWRRGIAADVVPATADLDGGLLPDPPPSSTC